MRRLIARRSINNYVERKCQMDIAPYVSDILPDLVQQGHVENLRRL